MEIFQVFIYICRFIFGSGNLDLYYGFAFIILLYSCMRDIVIVRKSIYMVIPLVIMGIFSSIISPYFSSQIKTILFLGKIFLNFVLFFYVKSYFYKFDLIKFIKITSNTMFLLTIISLIFNKGVFWRLNDIYNDFSKERLELLYLEPSILSMSVSLLILFILYYILRGKREKWLFISGIELIIILILSAGLNGIMCLFSAICLMLVIDNINYLKKKNISYISVAIVVIISSFIVIFINSDSNIIGRIMAIFNGKDGSSIYRYTLASNALKEILSETYFIGMGLGNMNTEKSLLLLNSLNMEKVFANSFMYFIAEAGVSGAIYIIVLITRLLKKAWGKNKIYKLPILIFIILYQVGGGYFTDPLIWITYAIICSDTVNMSTKKLKRVRIVIK